MTLNYFFLCLCTRYMFSASILYYVLVEISESILRNRGWNKLRGRCATIKRIFVKAYESNIKGTEHDKAKTSWHLLESYHQSLYQSYRIQIQNTKTKSEKCKIQTSSRPRHSRQLHLSPFSPSFSSSWENHQSLTRADWHQRSQKREDSETLVPIELQGMTYTDKQTRTQGCSSTLITTSKSRLPEQRRKLNEMMTYTQTHMLMHALTE